MRLSANNVKTKSFFYKYPVFVEAQISPTRKSQLPMNLMFDYNETWLTTLKAEMFQQDEYYLNGKAKLRAENCARFN